MFQLFQLALHPWHELSYGDQSPNFVEAVIEISKGMQSKYEIDKASGLLRLDRVIFGAFSYPINYGIIPQTLGVDGDPLDILVLSHVDILPLSIVNAKVIGLMQMIDTGVQDDKIIAVASKDRSVSQINSVNELPKELLLELKQFFEHYKSLESKTVEIPGFVEKEFAFQLMESCYNRYLLTYPKSHGSASI